MGRLRLLVLVILAAHLVQAAEPLPPVAPPKEPEALYAARTSRDHIGRIWAPVLINGQGPFRMVLDTGSNSPAIVPSVAEKLGIPILQSRAVYLSGVTGSAIVPLVLVDKMEFGDLVTNKVQVPVVADVFGGADGVLGARNWEDKRILIDFKHDFIRISQSQGEAAPPDFTRVPINLTDQHLIELDIQIGSVRTKAILDTGAQRSIGSGVLRQALMLTPKELKDQTIEGVTLDVERGENLLIPSFALGNLEVSHMTVTFSDMFIFRKWGFGNEPALLLGMDFIGLFDTVIIDYRMHEIQLLMADPNRNRA